MTDKDYELMNEGTCARMMSSFAYWDQAKREAYWAVVDKFNGLYPELAKLTQ